MSLVLVKKSATAPTSPQVGQLWIDTTTSASPKLKVYDGTHWNDAAGGIQTVSASGAATVTPGVQCLVLDNATQITATIADSKNHVGLFCVKAQTEPSTTHTVTLTAGTWDGTNDVATFADTLDLILVYFDGTGAGTVVLNTGAVTFS